MSHTLVTSPSPKNTRPLPVSLQYALEHLSGVDMSDVEVHVGSEVPEKYGVEAVTMGNRVYLYANNEHILAHEAWHVVQQKQGRVKAAMTSDDLFIDAVLEEEAHNMGALAQGLASIGLPMPNRHALKRCAITQEAIQPWIKITNDPNEIESKQWNAVGTVLNKLNEYENVNNDSHPGIDYVVGKMFNKNLSYDNYNDLLNDEDNILKPLFGFQHEKKMRELMGTQGQMRTTYKLQLDQYMQQKENEHNQKYQNRRIIPTFGANYWRKLYFKNNPRDFLIWGRKTSYPILKIARDPTRCSTPFLDELMQPNADFANSMNCWEAVLYSAMQARVVSADYVLWAIQDLTRQFRDKYLFGYPYSPVLPDNLNVNTDHDVPTFMEHLFSHSTHHSTILTNDYIAAGGNKIPALPNHIPRGQVVLFCGGSHVAISTGRRRQIANQAGRNACGMGHGILELDGEPDNPFADTIRETTIEDRILEKGLYGSEIWLGWLGDCPNQQVRIRYDSRTVQRRKRTYVVNANVAATNLYTIGNFQVA